MAMKYAFIQYEDSMLILLNWSKLSFIVFLISTLANLKISNGIDIY